MTTSAAMNWEALLSTCRFKINQDIISETRTPATEEGSQGLRTDFHIDHDRIVFSSAFRRLGRKTQVHPLARNDHTHNRLTHSVEVASVGRSLGNRVGLKLQQGGQLPAGYTAHDIGTVVQVACLAHDIGNPPFGHTGEDALRDWFRDERHRHWLQGLTPEQTCDVQTYEGNAHSLRMLTSLEMYGGAGGMRLTAAALGTLIKYPWTSSAITAQQLGKFNIYRTELAYFQCIADELGLLSRGQNEWSRHPLSYLMEAADDICYAILDLEDAVEIGILDFAEFSKPLACFAKDKPLGNVQNVKQQCAALRGKAIGDCVNEVAGKFMQYQQALLAGQLPAKDLINLCDSNVHDALLAAKDLASTRVYRHRTKLVTELAAYPCIAVLLDALVPAVHAAVVGGKESLKPRQQLAIGLLEEYSEDDSLYAAYMKVLDFVGGMTDNYAADLAREISGVGIL
ncbi:deoxyguanosinetriphosphate triphosphohydrolase [Neisseriaceae bacterium TC5R-5]|nr:deoxyguanosinetriphosphate triphosphohydrolase [Neisseriaceae bacterium TC5R-5]